jgi:hypothetical protein
VTTTFPSEPLRTLPDAHRLVLDFLRAQPELVDLVEDRIYTVVPNERRYPLLLVQQIGSSPLALRPWWAEQTDIQLAAYGATDRHARQVCELARSLCMTRLIGSDYEQGVVSWVSTLNLVALADDVLVASTGRALPRWVTTVTVTAHPHPAEAAPTPQVWPLVYPQFVDPQGDNLTPGISDIGGTSNVWTVDAEPPALADLDAFFAFLTEHGVGFAPDVLPEVTAIEFDSGLPGATSTVRVEPPTSAQSFTLRHGLPGWDLDPRAFAEGTYTCNVRALDAAGAVVAEGEASYEVVGPLIVYVSQRQFGIGAGPSDVFLRAWVGAGAVELFLDGAPLPIIGTEVDPTNGTVQLNVSIDPDARPPGTAALTLSVDGSLSLPESIEFIAAGNVTSRT